MNQLSFSCNELENSSNSANYTGTIQNSCELGTHNLLSHNHILLASGRFWKTSYSLQSYFTGSTLIQLINLIWKIDYKKLEQNVQEKMLQWEIHRQNKSEASGLVYC